MLLWRKRRRISRAVYMARKVRAESRRRELARVAVAVETELVQGPSGGLLLPGPEDGSGAAVRRCDLA
jgi:hypothetical protein